MKTSDYVPTYEPIWIRNSEENLKPYWILVSFCWNVRNLTARKKIIMFLRIQCSANCSLNDIWANITCWNVRSIDRNQTGWSRGDFWRFWERKKLIVKNGIHCDFFFLFKKQIGTYSYLSTSLDTSVQQLVNANIYSAKHMKETQCS